MASTTDSRTTSIKDIKKYFDIYDMEQKKRRVGYIFKNGTFQKDIENIKKALRVLEFNEADIEVHEFEEMKNVFEEFETNDIECFLCIILKRDETYNGCEDVDQVHELLSYLKPDRCESLIGVPKLIFVEASRGSEADVKVDIQSNVSANKQLFSKCQLEDDTLLYFSTFLGYPSFDNSIDGSWFIATLSKILIDYGTIYEITILLTAVSKYVASLEFNNDTVAEFSKCKQMPCIMSTLTKSVKFKRQANQI